jgi:plastocyanin
MRSPYVAIALLAVLLLAACAAQQAAPPASPAPPADPGAKVFNMVISHTRIDPSTIEVSLGDTVRINALSAPGTGVESGFSHNHGVAIDEYGINVATTSEVTPTSIDFVADKAGTFTIYCKTCWDGPFGHQHPDIRATLIVK